MKKIPLKSLFSKRSRLSLLMIAVILLAMLIITIIFIMASGSHIKDTPSTNEINVVPVSLGPNILLLLLFFISTTSMILLLFILSKKRVLVGNETFLISDEITKKIRLLENNINQMNNNLYISEKKNDSRLIEANNAIQEIKSVMNTYLKVLDEKDCEIRKYKNGYNSYLYEKFILRFVRIDRDLAEIHESGHVDLEDINQLRILMKHALSECGVEIFTPSIGDNFNNTKGVADNPKIIETEEEEKDFLIKEIIQPGYRQSTGDIHKDIVPAKVAIFRKI